jgi:hypothetical protein
MKKIGGGTGCVNQCADECKIDNDCIIKGGPGSYCAVTTCPFDHNCTHKGCFIP